jgi:hypothetical protein
LRSYRSFLRLFPATHAGCLFGAVARGPVAVEFDVGDRVAGAEGVAARDTPARLWLDTSGQTAAETADEILSCAWDEARIRDQTT